MHKTSSRSRYEPRMQAGSLWNIKHCYRFAHNFFCTSFETSDFIVDCIEMRWEENKDSHYPYVKELTINLDNGPTCASRRTQFIRRLVEFAEDAAFNFDMVISILTK